MTGAARPRPGTRPPTGVAPWVLWTHAAVAVVAALATWVLSVALAFFMILAVIVAFTCGCSAMRGGGWLRGLSIAAFVIAGLRLIFLALYFSLVIARVLPVP